MSVLRWVDNPRNSVAGFRVLKLVPGIGPAHAKQALEYFEAQGFGVKSLADFDAPQLNENGLEEILRARSKSSPILRRRGPGKSGWCAIGTSRSSSAFTMPRSAAWAISNSSSSSRRSTRAASASSPNSRWIRRR